MIVPVVDIAPLRQDRASAGATAVIARIDAACRETGFFVVVGHGIDIEMDDVFQAARAFYTSSQSVRDGVAMRRRCGYKADGVKEMFDVGLTDAGNQWPDLAGFRERVERYELGALAVAEDLLAGLSSALGISESFFAERMTAAECYLRLLHYPPQPAVPVSTGTHTDYGALTLLATDGVAGLQVHPIDGPWVDVVAPPGSLVVNLGDMLARWTNDRYRSTPHRVVAGADRERFSVPFFVNPDPDTVVECIPSCVDAARPCAYEPVTATDFLQGRIDGTIAVPLPADA